MFKKIKSFIMCSMLTVSGHTKAALPALTKNVNIKFLSSKGKTEAQKSVPSKQQAPRITVWVHGTKTMGPLSKYIHASPPGLKLVSDLPSRYRVRKAPHALAKADAERFPLEHFYTFGWSGALSFTQRKNEAQNLYNALKKLVVEYQSTYASKPEITVITHSHGGNVLLHMAEVKDDKVDFTVQAIVLACPVQHETKELVRDPFFKKIYSFYSTADFLQIIDPQGMYKTSKNKKCRFELSNRQFPVSDNMRQMQLRINGFGIMHIGFTLERFMLLLPDILDHADAWADQVTPMQGQERILNITLPEKKSWMFALPVGSGVLTSVSSKLKKINL